MLVCVFIQYVVGASLLHETRSPSGEEPCPRSVATLLLEPGTQKVPSECWKGTGAAGPGTGKRRICTAVLHPTQNTLSAGLPPAPGHCPGRPRFLLLHSHRGLPFLQGSLPSSLLSPLPGLPAPARMR